VSAYMEWFVAECIHDRCVSPFASASAIFSYNDTHLNPCELGQFVLFMSRMAKDSFENASREVYPFHDITTTTISRQAL
jgi:hypothetical protein